MKVLFDYCFDEEDLYFVKKVLNYSLEYPGDSLKGFSGNILKILKQIEDQEWLFDCVPDDQDRVLNFLFSKEELHTIALCAGNFLDSDDVYTLQVKCRVLTALLWTFFD